MGGNTWRTGILHYCTVCQSITKCVSWLKPGGQEQERSNKTCPNKIEEPARRRRDIMGMCE